MKEDIKIEQTKHREFKKLQSGVYIAMSSHPLVGFEANDTSVDFDEYPFESWSLKFLVTRRGSPALTFSSSADYCSVRLNMDVQLRNDAVVAGISGFTWTGGSDKEPAMKFILSILPDLSDAVIQSTGIPLLYYIKDREVEKISVDLIRSGVAVLID